MIRTHYKKGHEYDLNILDDSCPLCNKNNMESSEIVFKTSLFSGLLGPRTFILLSLGILILFAITEIPSVDGKVMIILTSLVFIFFALLPWFNITITNDLVYYKRYLLPWKNRVIPKVEVQGMRYEKKEKIIYGIVILTLHSLSCEVNNNEGDAIFIFSNNHFGEFNKTTSLLEKIITDNGGFIIKAD